MVRSQTAGLSAIISLRALFEGQAVHGRARENAAIFLSARIEYSMRAHMIYENKSLFHEKYMK